MSPDQLTAPLLYLSSEGRGWYGLTVSAYHEPAEISDWVDPVVPETVLILLTRGAMRMVQRRAHDALWSLAVRQGDLFLKPGGSVLRPTGWQSLSPEPMHTVHVHLTPELICRTVEELADRDPARLALVGRSGFQDALVTQIGLALWRELEQPSPTGKLYAETAAQMLAVHLLRCYSTTAIPIKTPVQGLTPRQMSRLTEFVCAHLSDLLSLAVLAQQTGFSPYHFARLFRQTTGKSPHQFVLHQRIERAKMLLQTTALPLAQIAVETGFASQSHLTQTFKRHLGLTPAAYRKLRTFL